MSEYQQLTGFKPGKRSGRFRLLLDYGYGPGSWVEACGAKSIEAIRRERGKLAQWPDSKVRIVDLEELA